MLQVAICVALIAWHGWRALLCLKPDSLTLEVDTPAATEVPGALVATHGALLQAGFVMLGTHLEAPKLRKALTLYDYVHHGHGAYASIFLGAPDSPRWYLLTDAKGGLVMTANYRRRSVEQPGYASGNLEGASVDRLLKAHLRMASPFGQPHTPLGLEERVALARRWYRGVGRREVRLDTAVSLLWTLAALIWMLTALGLVRLPRL